MIIIDNSFKSYSLIGRGFLPWNLTDLKKINCAVELSVVGVCSVRLITEEGGGPRATLQRATL